MDNDERITRVEERFERYADQTRLELQSIDVRLTKIEARLDETVTKADLERAINSIVKWMVGTMFGAGVVSITVMTFVLNNAVPKQAPPAPTAPFVIQLPPGTQVTPRP